MVTMLLLALVSLPQTDVVAENGLEPVGVEGGPLDRIARAEARVAAAPESYEARREAAETYAQVSLTEPDREAREDLLRRGHVHATAATALDPEAVDGHYWLAATAGLLADVTGGRTKVRFGDEVFRESSWILTADSLHAGAHYLQGRVHAGVMRLGSGMRFLAKLFVGGDALGSASWVKAEYHLRRAAELQPELAMHHFELAMAYEEMQWPDHMRHALLETLQATASTPFQDEYKQRAREILGASDAR